MFLAMARPSPVPPRLVVKYGSKTRARSAASMPRPRSAITIATRSPRASVRSVISGSGGPEPGPGRDPRRSTPRATTAWRAFTSMLTSAIRSRSASVVIGGSDRCSTRWTEGPGPDAWAAAADSRQSGVQIRRRQLETNRPREVEHLVDDAVQARDFVVDVGDRLAQRDGGGVLLAERVQRGLDDHQRVSDFVGDDRRQPAERRQPLLLRHLALETRDRIGQRVERRRQQPRVLVVPAVALQEGDLARQVAGRGHFAHRAGDGRQGARDGARDGEAEQRRRGSRRRSPSRSARRESPAARPAARCATGGSAPPGP